MNRFSVDAPRQRAGTLLLAAGAALGVALAALGLVRSGRGVSGTLPGNAVARVNGELIRLDDYRRVLAGLAQDTRNPIDEAQRKHVLDRLIDEELLVQRGLELGLARTDGKIRKDLTAAVIDAVVAATGEGQPSEAELESFYEQNRAFFAGPGRLRMRQIVCQVRANADAPGALDRAQQAAQRVRRGDDFAAVRAALGDTEPAPLPDASLPLAKLIDYLGPTAARVATELEVGEVSDPVRSSTGYHVLQVVERVPDRGPPLADIKPQVEAEFRRRASDQALRTYLDELRARANVTIADTPP
ncbi:MAG TPA: peptidylprolyl isomerase [Candidatus Binatia bacterium]|nr:peptidylprolyl isomerase [Candidatus Binatia bacterium]